MAEEVIGFEQIKDVIDFAQGLALAKNMGYYTPWTQNQVLTNLNNNPRMPKLETIQKALANYKDESGQLKSFMDFMKHWDMVFARVLQSYVNILSFDLQVIPFKDGMPLTKEDFVSEDFKKDKKKVDKFLDAFDYKAEFRKAVMQMMTTETAYYWFRRSKWGNRGMRGTLQLMPQDYCKITGYWEKGLLYDS